MLAVLLGGTVLAAPDGPRRPGSGSRSRKSGPTVPVPPPPPAGEWTTQSGAGTMPSPTGDGAPAAPAAPPAEEPAGLIDVTPPPPDLDPLFNDSPTESFEPVSWRHAPSGVVVSNESYTEEACTRLLADATLPATARAAVLGGRARARMRMWRLDAARADIEEALALDPRSAPLHLVHAELLACFNSTDDADLALQAALQLDPESSLIARALGLLRFQQGDMQSSADALTLHLAHTADLGTAAGDATLPLLRAVAAGDFSALDGRTDPEAPWTSQLTAFLAGRIDRETLLARAHDPRGVAPDEAACTTWFYLGQRSLARHERERATLDLLACIRTGYTMLPEYRIAVAQLIRLRALRADSLPGRLAQ
ncbi:MAG: hypothetical protein IAE82_21745 [Opitutaceae bacterium]|nr:hypothetical protein [Opitutaceae bacterium]